jgi:hypothetical protein
VIEAADVPVWYTSFRNRWQSREARHLRIDEVCAGNLDAILPDDEKLGSKSPNIIQVGIEDTADAASLMPTVRVQPCETTKESKRKAEAMEKIATGYLNNVGGNLWLTGRMHDLVRLGLCVSTVGWDDKIMTPVIEERDPRTFYPEPGWRPGAPIHRAIFAREIFYSQLPPDHRRLIADAVQDKWRRPVDVANAKVVLIEAMDCDETVLCALFDGKPYTTKVGDYIPVVLARAKNPGHIAPVAVGQRISGDAEPRGQFDQAIEPMLAHARLMAMAIDYADQSTYSDIWVKGLIGELPYGGGGVIQLDQNGAIGRVPPAVSSMSLFNELQLLSDSVHMGGRWPKTRSGEIEQSQASGKFVESSVALMNTAIKGLHSIFKDFGEQLLRLCFLWDNELSPPGKKTMAGVLSNRRFLEDYDPAKDIDVDCNVELAYGLGFGRDPGQSAVLHIQYLQTDLISKETVQENIEGLYDVERERRRIDVEKLSDMAFGKLMMGLEQGSIPDEALIAIAKARNDGADIFSVYEQFIVKPKQQAAASALTSGLPGMGALQPGPPGGQQALPAGPSVPPPPDAPSMLARLTAPAGGQGSFISSQSKTGG